MALSDPQYDENGNIPFNQRNYLASLVEPGNPGIPPMSASPFTDSYTMGPDESGWGRTDYSPRNFNNTGQPVVQAQATIPAQPTQQDLEHPESRPLISAIENGYADKKIMSPVDEIRKGIQLGDTDMVDKGHRKLVDLLQGKRSFGERFADAYLRNNEFTNSAHKVASDIVMNEMVNATGLGQPKAEDAVRLGLIHPNELVPGDQSTEAYAHLIPQEPFAMDQSGMPISSVQMRPNPAQPDQEPTATALPNARLTPLQSEVATSRQRAISSGLAIRKELADSLSALREQKGLTEQYKRDKLLPAQIESQRHLNNLRDMQGQLAEARIDWLKKLPELRRELSTGTTPFELEAIKRVHKAIQSKQPIDKADWLITERWLRKGAPIFSSDFLGNMFNRLTGEKQKKGQPFGWVGLPEPPDTSDEQKAEAEDIDNDMMHQLGTFLGDLIRGIAAPKEEAKPSPLSKDEQAELEALRKKHGRQPK